MNDLMVVLDIQHGWKGSWYDPGAMCDQNSDGVIEEWEHEHSLSAAYAEYARMACAGFGLRCAIVPDEMRASNYADGMQWANRLAQDHRGPAAFVACHLNSVLGDPPKRGIVGYYSASPRSRLLAQCLTQPLKQYVPDLVEETAEIPVDPQADERYRRSMHYTIREVGKEVPGMAAVCYEPAFIQHLRGDRAAADRHCRRIGLALARGLLTYTTHGRV